MDSKHVRTLFLVAIVIQVAHQFDDDATLGIPVSYRPSFRPGGDNYPGSPD